MTPSLLAPLEQLLIQSACRDLVLRTAALADQGDFAAMTEQFAPDAVLQRPSGEPLHGRAAILASYAQRPADRLSMHLILGTRFLGLTTDHAEAITQVQVWNASTADSAGPFGRPARGKELVGHFHDQFCWLDGRWQIARRRAAFDLFIELP